jgi:hypothetical protein
VLFAVDPLLTNSQVGFLLERSADDVNATNGCPRCGLLRDSLSGWGRLDVAKAVEALAGPVPPPDSDETNDDAGTSAWTVWGTHDKVQATIDYWDDPVDVYRIQLRKQQLLHAQLATGGGPKLELELWKPKTVHVDRPSSKSFLAMQSSVGHLAFRSPVRGWYYLEVRAPSPESTAYMLQITKTAAIPPR